MKYTIKQSIEWLQKKRNINVKKQYLQRICNLKIIESEMIGRMRFIRQEDLDRFNFRSPGRPKIINYLE